MKIIRIDNFDRETVSDVLVANRVPKHYADTMVEALNKEFSPGDYSQDFFRVVEDDYKLYKFKP